MELRVLCRTNLKASQFSRKITNFDEINLINQPILFCHQTTLPSTKNKKRIKTKNKNKQTKETSTQ